MGIMGMAKRAGAPGEGEPGDISASLFVPTPAQADPDAEWRAWLQAQNEASIAVLAPVMRVWEGLAAQSGAPLGKKDLAHAQERCRDALSTVSSALLEALPRAKHHSGEALLRIRFCCCPDSARVGWDGEPEEDEPLLLMALIRHRLSMVGDFKNPALDSLARAVIMGIDKGFATLPQFENLGMGKDGDLMLRWGAK